MNITQISSTCSLIRHKWAWRRICSTTEIDSTSVPLTHAANMMDGYAGMQLLLGRIKYEEFKWKLCDDLKVLTLLFGMQLT